MTAKIHLALRLGAWFITHTLQNAYWHIPIDPRCKHFLAVQMEDTILQFTAVLFGLNIAPPVLTKIMKPMAHALSHLRIKILMYFDNWVIQAQDCLHCDIHQGPTLSLACKRGLLINLTKSHLDSENCLVQDGTGLSDSYSVAHWTVTAECCSNSTMLWSFRTSSSISGSLMGCLSYAATVVPLDHICHCHLPFECKLLFLTGD